jgi:hypothetical protein
MFWETDITLDYNRLLLLKMWQKGLDNIKTTKDKKITQISIHSFAETCLWFGYIV